MKPRSLDQILQGRSGSLARLVEKARQTDRLSRQVRDIMPKNLADHVIGANFRDDQLVVITDSAAWAARIRYLDQELRTQLEQTTGLRSTRLIVKVRAPCGD